MQRTLVAISIALSPVVVYGIDSCQAIFGRVGDGRVRPGFSVSVFEDRRTATIHLPSGQKISMRIARADDVNADKQSRVDQFIEEHIGQMTARGGILVRSDQHGAEIDAEVNCHGYACWSVIGDLPRGWLENADIQPLLNATLRRVEILDETKPVLNPQDLQHILDRDRVRETFRPSLVRNGDLVVFYRSTYRHGQKPIHTGVIHKRIVEGHEEVWVISKFGQLRTWLFKIDDLADIYWGDRIEIWRRPTAD